jgi:hypothetical protein
MDDSAGKSFDGKGLGDGENAGNKAAKSGAREGAAPEHKLPVVWSPKLDAADDIEDDAFGFGAREIPHGETAAKDGAKATGASAPSRSGRFALLAASVSIAAAVGSFAATLALTGFNHDAPASALVTAQNSSTPESKSSRELAELSAIKSSLDNASRSVNAQFAAISQRLERVEHTQVDPSQLAHISDTVDRLTRLNAAPETTGSIAAPTAAPAAPAAPAEPKITDRILEDWVVEDVHGNRALVASRYGGEFLIMPGSMLPGAGHVDAVKRQDGHWVVMTAKGMITEGAALPR